MDFRSLIGKLEKIEQRQLLQESTSAADQVLTKELEILKEAYMAVMERLTYKINQAAGQISDEEARKAFLGKAAAKNGYPGLFDPVTGKFVDSQGQYAWFGAYKSEVEQMERDGLIPEKARTEALLGLLGKDRDTAFGNSEKVASKDRMVDTAEEIMAKGRQSWDPTASGSIKESKRGTLAQSITESFGYTFKQLVESITREEHKQLKDIVVKLKDYEGDPDATRVLKAYDEYVRIRTIIIGKIDAILKELATLRGTALNESREMLREEIYVFGNEETNEYGALKLYYDANNNLVEYSLKDFGQDASDMGRGAAKSVSFGYSDNIVAGIKSMFKGTKYADELKKELKATDDAWERSPYLYGAGYAAGMAPYFLTGPVGVGLGLAGTASEISGIRDKHNLNTLVNREKEVAAGKGAEQSSQKVQPTAKIKYSPEVEKLQQLMLSKDPNALPKHGADGKMGPETIAAAKRLGIALPSSTPAAPTAASTQVDPAVAQELMTALGAKDPTSAVTAFNSKVKASGADAGTVLAQLIGLTPATVKESITFSSMSESERMSYLLNKMTMLEGIEALGRPILSMLELAAGKGTAAVMAALTRAIPNIASKGVTIAGETWAPIAGQVGKFSNGRGAVMEAEQILHLITNTSTLGDTVAVAGINYQKMANGWAKVGKDGKAGLNVSKAESQAIEKEWAKVHGKDPHAPAPKAADPAAPKAADPAAPKIDPAAAAANDAVIPANKVAQWVQTKYPRLTGAYRKIVAGGKVSSKFISSNKWWSALAALVAWGYIWPGVTDDASADSSASNSDQKVDTSAEDNSRREKELTAQLGSLTKMLQDMFPDDQEALDAINRASGEQSDQKVDTSATNKLDKPGWDPNFTGSVGGGNISGYKNK